MSGRSSKRAGAALAIAGLLASGCVYDPPVVGDRASPRYQSDLTECRAAADKAAHHAVIIRGLLFFTYPISLPIKERQETKKCMTDKGYTLADGSHLPLPPARRRDFILA